MVIGSYLCFVAFYYMQRITEQQNKVCITDRMWARLLASTNQPSFLGMNDVARAKEERITAESSERENNKNNSA